MFRTDLLSIIKSLNSVYTAIVICHTSYANCLLADSITIAVYTAIVICHTSYADCLLVDFVTTAVYTVLRLLMIDSRCLKHVEFFIKINLRNSASRWLLL